MNLKDICNLAVALLRVNPHWGIQRVLDEIPLQRYVEESRGEPDDLAAALNDATWKTNIRTNIEMILVEEVLSFRRYTRTNLLNMLVNATRVNTRFHVDGIVDKDMELDYFGKGKIKVDSGILIEVVKQMLK